MKNKSAISVFLTLFLAAQFASAAAPLQPGKHGTARELFVDNHLIAQLSGDLKQHLHQPVPKEVILTTDAPWEGNTCAYYTIFRDGNIFRMYYRGHHHGSGEDARGEPMCYAESRDGIRWTKPNLGLFRFGGSSDNNIVLGGDGRKYLPTDKWQGKLGTHTGLGWRGDMVPFIDTSRIQILIPINL